MFKLTAIVAVVSVVFVITNVDTTPFPWPNIFNWGGGFGGRWPGRVFGRSMNDGSHLGEEESLMDHFLFNLVPSWLGQRPFNQNGTKSIFKQYAMEDDSNDDAFKMSSQELILRSGYKFESHDCVSDDGYITTLTRIVNPLADRKRFRWPPVLMMHGGTLEPTAYLLASSIQHHPEPWPRTDQDGPFTSWNRSLAFMLANNGFDVWLAETRGSNEKNLRHIKTKALETAFEGENIDKNMTFGESINEILKQWDYWSFNQDDIIQHEVKAQIDLVLNKTNSKKISMFTFALSVPTTLAFLSTRPDYAEKIQGFISMAPIMSGFGTHNLIRLIYQGICPWLPNEIGTLVLSDIFLTEPMRDLFVFLAKPKSLRYSFVKLLLNFIMGPSAKYETLLELNMLGHMLKILSLKELKQLCQQMVKNKLSKYDHGPVKNKLIYGQFDPPAYDLSQLRLKDWIIVAAANDQLATSEVMEHLIGLVNPKPIGKIVAPGFNHIDLIAGVENDKYVNVPILRYLQSQSVISGNADFIIGSGARQLDIRSLLPPEFFSSEKLAEQTKQLSKTFETLTNLTNLPNLVNITNLPNLVNMSMMQQLPNIVNLTGKMPELAKFVNSNELADMANITNLNPMQIIVTIQRTWTDLFGKISKILPALPTPPSDDD